MSEDDPFGPEAYKRHRSDCICWDCEGAREDAHYAFMKTREGAAATYRIETAGALTALDRAEKALAAVVKLDTGGCDGDIGGDADDALAELREAGKHLRNVFRVALLHERDIAAELAAIDPRKPKEN